MTVDIARMPSNALAVFDNTDDALARLAKWVEAASNAQRLVGPLIGTPFVPEAYRPKIERGDTEEQIAEKRAIATANGTAAVLYGLSLNIDPLMALQQIYVVHGRPGMYAKMMVALVQSRGHEVWTEDLTDTRAVVCGRRKGSQHPERITITMDMARRAKWTTNAKYQETPQDMLWARAAGRVCDRIASDVLKGIATVEQIQDETPDDIKATAEVGKRTVAPRRAAPAIEASVEPALEPEQPAATGPVEASITAPQQKKLHALLNEKGLGDRDLGLGFIAGVLDRDLESTKELTKADAGRVIEALEAVPSGAVAEPALDDDGSWPDAARPADAELEP